MSTAVRLLDVGEVSALRSQALYHGLAEAAGPNTPDTIVLCWPSQAYFSVGYHQDPERELDLEHCRREGLPVLHRRIGGGTVYLDRDQLFYQVVLHASRAPWRVDSIYERFLAGPVAALRALGLEAALVGSNEIEVGGRRIAGTGGGQIEQAMVLTGNIVLEFPYGRMSRAWRVPNEAFRQLAARALEGCLTTLRRESSRLPEMDELRALLARSFAETLKRPLCPGELTATELRAVGDAEGRIVSCLRPDPVWTPPLRVLKIARGVYVREELEGGERRVVCTREGVVEAALPLPPGAGRSREQGAAEDVCA